MKASGEEAAGPLLHEELGSGSFGVVWRGTYCGRAVAVKALPHKDGFPSMARAQEEAAIHRVVSPHPALVALHACITRPDATLLVLELCAGVGLTQYVEALPASKLDAGAAKLLLRQLASALQHCHTLGVAHMDVKPENVMVTSASLLFDARIKLIDYGSAVTFDAEGPGFVEDRGGTEAYMAPERLDGGSLLDPTSAAFDKDGRVRGSS